ncbi:MAG: ribosome silencing factor [Verrucomicrobia bacterium]|jgi:ribosome-associated protein|nr:ribosome silencing factor [Verrucomicrobiota bacterium]
MDSRKLAQRCRELADDRKAEDIVVLDVRKLSSVTDFFVIASALSDPHLRAIVEEVEVRLKQDDGIPAAAVDGTTAAGWVVLDYFDVMVHVMRRDIRERYDLEGLWNDAPRVRAKAARKRVS